MTQRSRFLILCLFVVLLTTHRLPAPIIEETPPPAKQKPHAKVPTKTKSEVTAESGMSSRAVQVVLTDNTRATILYLKNYEGKPFTDVRPDELLQQLRQALSTQFSN